MNHQSLKNCILAISLALFSLPLKCMEAEDARPNNQTKSYDPYQSSLLIRACDNNNLPAVLAALQAGADPNFRGENQTTPLHGAAFDGYTEILLALLQAGANANAQDKSKETPLHKAVWKKHIKAVEVLVASEADVNIRCELGNTPLHTAAAAGTPEIAEMLINAGADIEAKTNEKAVIWDCIGIPDNFPSEWTPLQYAVARGRSYKTIKLLLAHGADLESKDSKGRTPLEIILQRLDGTNRSLDMSIPSNPTRRHEVEQIIRVLKGEQPLPENHTVPATGTTTPELPQPRITTPQRTLWGFLFGARNTK